MKILILTILAVLLVSQSDLKPKYDRFRDETTVSTGLQYVDMKSPGRLETAAYFSYKGQAKASNGLIIGLAFYSSSSHWRFVEHDDLIALIDGERLEFGNPIVKTSRLGRRTGVDESLSYKLTRSDLNKIASAQQVEMQIGTVEFKLTGKFLNKLKDLEAALPPE